MPRRGENIWKRKDGRWEARYIRSRDENGKAQYASVYAGSYLEVKEKRAKALEVLAASAGRRTSLDKSSTLKSISEEYLVIRKPVIKESSYSRYNDLLDWYVYPSLGTKAIVELCQEDFEQLSAALSGSGGKTGLGLSPKTIKDVMTLLKQILSYAEKKGISPISSAISFPQQQRRSPIIVMTPSDQKTLEAYIRNNLNVVGLGIWLSLYSGLRIGELCGLMWKDLNLTDGVLTVSRTVLRIHNNDANPVSKTKLVISKPKTNASKRTIPIHSEILKILKSMTLEYDHSDMTFLLSGSNKPTEPRNYYAKYKRILQRCGLQDYTFHAKPLPILKRLLILHQRPLKGITRWSPFIWKTVSKRSEKELFPDVVG